MAYLINPQAAAQIETRTFVLTPSEVQTIGSSPYQLSTKENWFPFFYGFECETFTTPYDFTEFFCISDLTSPAVYFKPNRFLQDLQGIGLSTAIYLNSGIFLQTADFLNNGTSLYLTTITGTDATTGDGDFTIKISGMLF